MKTFSMKGLVAVFFKSLWALCAYVMVKVWSSRQKIMVLDVCHDQCLYCHLLNKFGRKLKIFLMLLFYLMVLHIDSVVRSLDEAKWSTNIGGWQTVWYCGPASQLQSRCSCHHCLYGTNYYIVADEEGRRVTCEQEKW